MNGLCRCCLSEGEFRSLDAPYECDGNDSYSALLRETFNINISPMPGPDNASTYTICDRCTSQLQDAAQFRNHVLESEKRFTAYVENYLRGDNAPSADKIHIEAETLQDEQIEYTLSTYIVKEEIENDLAINEEIEHTSIEKEVVETDNAMAISPDDGNDYVNEFDCKIDVCDDDNRKGDERYPCDICNEIFRREDKLRSHVLDNHIFSQDSRDFSCDITFNGHERAEYHCAFCTDTFPTLKSLKTHELTHTKKSGYICDYCKKSYKHKRNLSTHIYHHIGNYKKYICETCEFITKHAHYLKVHVTSVHNKIRPFKCDLCPKSYKFKNSLKQHRRVHTRTGVLPYECDVCFKRFRSVSGFKVHKNRHLLKTVGPSTPRRSSTEIKQDQARIGTEIRAENSNNKCHICGKNFVHKSFLKQHLYCHTKPFKCHVCGEGFSFNRLLRMHMLRRHDSSKQKQTHELTHTKKSEFICDYCQKSLKYKDNLVTHIKCHTGNYKKYICETCGYVTKRVGNLKVHIRSVHDKIRPFECDQCPKTYKSKWHLTEHIRVVHTGELLYECDVCVKRFRTNVGFKRHKRKHLLKSVGPSTQRRSSIKMTHDQARKETEIAKSVAKVSYTNLF